MLFSFSKIQRFFGELQRRHVTRVAAAYAVAAFVIMQAVTTFFPALKLPEWCVTLIAVLCVVGFPVALVAAWALDLTPDGVRWTDSDRSAPNRWNRLTVAAAALIITSVLGAFALTRISKAGPSVNAIAVLPFDNWSGNRENEYFSDGITDDVLTQLARIDGLKVISRTSVMQYKGGKKPIAQIANELRVGAVLEGSVRRSGNKVRIVAQLIDATNDHHLWAETYDRDISDIFEVQSEIATDIAAALRTKLTPQKRAELKRVASHSTDPLAYEEYLRGLEGAAQNDRTRSNEHFMRALSIDPKYAPAHAALARNYYFQAFLAAKPAREAFPLVKQSAVRALQLDEEQADAHATYGLYLMHYDFDFRAADREFRRALELAPANAQVHHDYAHYLLAMGRTAESAAESVRAAELDPNNTMLQACAGWHRFADSHYSAAIEGARKALMMMPNMFWPEIILGWGQEESRDFAGAIKSLRNAVAHSEQRPFAKAALAYALARDGQRAEAAALLRELEQPDNTAYVSAYDVAAVHAGLGNRARALDWLAKAKQERSSFLVFIGWDPRFADLRADARYRQLIREIGLPS